MLSRRSSFLASRQPLVQSRFNVRPRSNTIYLRILLVSRQRRPLSGVKAAATDRPRSRGLASNITAGSILSHNPSAVTQSEILSVLDASKPSIASNYPKGTVVLVFSKVFANLADDEHFLRQAITRLFPSSEAESIVEVQAVVAVVDSIPCNSAIIHNQAEAKAAGHEDSTCAEKSNSNEYEGIAYLGDGAGEFITQLESVRNEVRASSRRSPGDSVSAVSIFSFQLVTPDDEYTVELPLADTLFLNGHRCTLITSQWRRGCYGTNANEFEHVQSQFCSHVTIRLDMDHHGSAKTNKRDAMKTRNTLSVPLTPLTPLRKIVDSMGNVIRKIAAESEVGASVELEQSIADYFSTHGITPQTVSVWAAVVPREVYSSTSAKSLSGANTMPHAFRLIQAGGALHRVLSGGGGWGSKAGLLSLDNQITFAQKPSAALLDFPGLSRGENLGSSAAIVEPGDYVAFYIFDPTYKLMPKDIYTESKGKDPDFSLEFGVASGLDGESNTYSTEPISGEHLDSELGGSSLESFQNKFGAQSAKGIGLTKRPLVLTTAQYKTKIDVPFARIALNLSWS